jgi:hypothetical protein
MWFRSIFVKNLCTKNICVLWRWLRIIVETCRCDSELMDKCHLLEINLCEKFNVFIFPKGTIKLISVILFVMKINIAPSLCRIYIWLQQSAIINWVNKTKILYRRKKKKKHRVIYCISWFAGEYRDISNALKHKHVLRSYFSVVYHNGMNQNENNILCDNNARNSHTFSY